MLHVTRKYGGKRLLFLMVVAPVVCLSVVLVIMMVVCARVVWLCEGGQRPRRGTCDSCICAPNGWGRLISGCQVFENM